AFAPGGAFWLFRTERVPPRIHGLLQRTPGLELYLPVTDTVAVAAGYRHPIPLESCRGSFSPEKLTLFSPRGVTEISPAPVLAALEDVVRLRVPATAAVALARAGKAGERPGEEPEPFAASPAARPELAVTLRLEPSGDPPGRPVAAFVPWELVPWLQRLFYALPPTV